MSHSPVLKLVAGANVTLTPSNGQGIVTINATAGAGASAYYVVTRATGAPVNAVNLGLLTSGVLQQTVALGVSTVAALNVGAGLVPFGTASTGVLTTNATLRVYSGSGGTAALSIGTPHLGSPSAAFAKLWIYGGNAGDAARIEVVNAATTGTSELFLNGDNGLGSSGGRIYLTGTAYAGAEGAGTLVISNFAWPTQPAPGDILFYTGTAGAGKILTLKSDAGVVYWDSSAAVSPTGSSALRSNAGRLQVSENGGAWTNITGGSGGITQLTGDVAAGPGTGSQAATIAANAVTFAKMQTIADQRLVGNVSGATAVPAALTQAQVRTFLGLGTAAFQPSTAFLQVANNLGDVGSAPTARANLGLVAIAASGSGADLTNGTVTYAKIQNVTNSRVLGNVSGAPAAPQELTAGDLTTLLGGPFLSGTLTATYVLYATGASTVGQDSRFNYVTGTGILTVPSIKSNTVNAPTGDLTLGTTAGGSQVAINPVTLLIVGGTGVQLSAFTSNGFVKTSGGIGTLTVDTTTYLDTTTAASTYQPKLSATATRVLYSGGGSTISSDGAFTWDNANGLLTITNANQFGVVHTGLWIKDVGAAANANLRVDSSIRCSSFAGGTVAGGLPISFYDGASVALGPEVFRIDNGEIHSLDTSGNTSFHVTGGAIELGTGGIVNNGTTAVTLTSLGPAGASTTVRKWLPITVAGTTYYAPLF